MNTEQLETQLKSYVADHQTLQSLIEERQREAQQLREQVIAKEIEVERLRGAQGYNASLQVAVQKQIDQLRPQS